MRKIFFGGSLILALVSPGAWAVGEWEEVPDSLEDCYAQAVPMASLWRGYLGLMVGGDLNKLQIGQQDQLKNHNIFGFRPGIYGGVGWNWRHLYLGGELGVTYHWLSKKSDFSVGRVNGAVKVAHLGLATADLIMGYLNRSRSIMPYLKLGVGLGWNRISADWQDLIKSYSISKNNLTLGYQGGIGLEWLCTQNFSMKFEVLYGKYKGIDYQGEDFNYRSDDFNSWMFNLGLAGVF